MTGNVRLISFFLPQFHPFPQNDEWWGKGFTEWTNATKAQPLFEGHYQPHLPTDLGFYDLRLRQTRREQIAMAKQYGIDAFCYHYYWFSGTRLLHEPVDDMLIDPESDMPFCLCWANENWTRRWDAAETHVLIAQKYQENDDLDFIKSVEPFFRDPRYVRLDGAPVLIVYRPQHLPDSKKTIGIWREYCASVGIPKLHLVCALTHGNLDHEKYGFDAGVEFPPHHPNVAPVSEPLNYYDNFTGVIFDYKDIANSYLNREYPAGNVYRGVFPSWDNTARLGRRALVTLNGTPENYEYWLKQAVEKSVEDYPAQERLVFINAWNEWAEGCHLEPDRKYGRQFLEATQRVASGTSAVSNFAHVGVPEQARIAAVSSGIDVSSGNAAAENAVSAASTRSDDDSDMPHPRAPAGRRSALSFATTKVRRGIGLLLRPFPRSRQFAVRIYQEIFDRNPNP